MKQTRQAVGAIKQSIFLDVYACNAEHNAAVAVNRDLKKIEDSN
jgi:hypothetical protein